MTFAVSMRHTMAGAKHVVPDVQEPKLGLRRQRLIESSRRWMAMSVVVAQPPPDAVRIMAERGMPGWARSIVVQVSRRRGVSLDAMVSGGRGRKDIVPARYEAFYRLRMTVSPLTGRSPSYPVIAAWFQRDHTVVLYGAAKHASTHGLPITSAWDVQRKIARSRAAAIEFKRGGK